MLGRAFPSNGSWQIFAGLTRIVGYETAVERKDKRRFLLIQVRDQDDPIRQQEIMCFARSANCSPDRMESLDLLSDLPPWKRVHRFDAVFIGGSGRYSTVGNAAWLAGALSFLGDVAVSGVPLFASCWGFQALSRALGGDVVHDRSSAELGTGMVSLTDSGLQDPIFGTLPSKFPAFMGHEDCVKSLPERAELLASSDVSFQAFRLSGLPVYGTQFHPELSRDAFLDRVRAYPRYIKEIAGQEMSEFERTCTNTPEATTLIPQFLDYHLGS